MILKNDENSDFRIKKAYYQKEAVNNDQVEKFCVFVRGVKSFKF